MRLKSFAVLALCGVFVLTGASLVGCNKKTETVKGPDKAGNTKELSVTGPATVNVTQGSQKEVKISVERKNMDDAVDFKVENLPKGVSIVEPGRTIPKSETSATFTLKADADAAVVDDHVVRITASGGGLTAKTIEMKVDVEKK